MSVGKINKFDLEERLINFSVKIIKIAESMPSSFAANHLSGQLIRSGTSAALNYGEAQGGESRKDFVHKIKIVLKELRETYVCLRIINISKLHTNFELMKEVLTENNELISFFVKSTETAQKNMNIETNQILQKS